MTPLVLFALLDALSGFPKVAVAANDVAENAKSQDAYEAALVAAKRQQAIEDARKEATGQSEFLSSYFGIGAYAGFDFGSDKRVESARVINGIVRVEEESAAQVGLMLEAHRIFALDKDKHAGLGPYVGLVAAGDNIISSGAIGALVAMRPTGAEKSLNVGIGLSVTPHAQVLGDGLRADKPLPTGETEARMKKKTVYGLALSLSFGF